MRKLTEKIALVAQICITLVFAVTTIINLTNVLNNNAYDSAYNGANMNDSVLTSLIIVLFVAYAGLSAYMLYANFSERENLKRVLLFCDSESSTHATTKVVRKIISDCEDLSTGVKVKKINIRPDEKQGFGITLKIKVAADNVAQAIDSFRCLLADGFKNTLNMTFNSINFVVVKLTTNYAPRVDEAQEKAEKLGEQREVVEEIYNEPLENDVNVSGALPDKKQSSHKQKDA